MKRKKKPSDRLAKNKEKEIQEEIVLIKSALMGLGLGFSAGFAKQLKMSSTQFARMAKNLFEGKKPQ